MRPALWANTAFRRSLRQQRSPAHQVAGCRSVPEDGRDRSLIAMVERGQADDDLHAAEDLLDDLAPLSRGPAGGCPGLGVREPLDECFVGMAGRVVA